MSDAQTADFEPGETPPAAPRLARFAVSRHLASGGLGDVFVARDAELPRDVALKRVRAVRADDADARAAFVREAEVTGSLEHPGVVPVYALGRADDGRPYYAMRLVAGRTLRDAVASFHAAGGDFRSLAFRQLLQRFVVVCQTVEFAHSRGVIHRDLKPSNIMLGDFGETLVIDWGLARHIGEPGAEGTIQGTFEYMAPEQAAGAIASLGPACDVFALGGVLFTLLTGEVPTGEASRLEILANLDAGSIRGPREASPRVPRALDAVCRRAMAHDPSRRYGSAAELAAEIERWLADDPVRAFRDPLPARAARWTRRHPGSAASLGATLAVGALALAVGLAVVGGKNAELRASEARARDRLELARGAVEAYLGRAAEEPALRLPALLGLRRRLLENAVPFFRRLAEADGDSPPRRDSQGMAYKRLGMIADETGDYAAAAAAHGSAADIFAKLADEFPNEPAYRGRLAASRHNRARALSLSGDAAGAARESAEAIALREQLVTESPTDPEFRAGLAVALEGRGPAESARALGLMEALVAEHPHVSRHRADLAFALRRRGRLPEAAAHFGRLLNDDPGSAEFGLALGECQQALGVKADTGGDRATAERECRAAVATVAPLAADTPAPPERRALLAVCRNSLAVVLAGRGDRAGAAREYAETVALLERLVAESPEVGRYRRDLGNALANAGRLAHLDGRPADALPLFTRALAELAAARKLTPDDPLARRFEASVRVWRVLALAELGRGAERLPEPRRAVPGGGVRPAGEAGQ